MKNGYKLLWSDRAVNDLRLIIKYLTENWTEREIRNFSKKLDKRLEIILVYPRLFPKTEKRKNVRRSVLTRHTIIYYEVSNNAITLLTFFDSRTEPGKLKI